MRLNDPDLVRAEYATEAGLRARRSFYDGAVAAAEAVETALAAVREARPQHVLEVGCGWGEFAARLRDELRAEVVGVDLSPRMVELARDRGLDARIADVQALPFADDEFDCVAALWMLYHVPDLDRALAEVARVLRPGGTLVAATSSHLHLVELWSLVGRDRASEPVRFFAETGTRPLRRHFRRVERRDVRGTIVFRDAEAARDYIRASVAHKHLAERVPDFDAPLRATCANAVFVAEKPA
ncbi:MAG TPA: class I SAM-dependent methyltransferase [Gaiellaceae bacterium]|nr:class I SAM-dependent methyltransferase [Gaiellaceae bacterium]